MPSLILSNGLKTIVDWNIYYEMAEFTWFAAWHGETVHAQRRDILMERAIMRVTDEREVEHVNGDALDNRRENLLVVDHATHDPKYGVAVFQTHSGFSVQIWCGDRYHHLDSCDTCEEAQKVRKEFLELTKP